MITYNQLYNERASLFKEMNTRGLLDSFLKMHEIEKKKDGRDPSRFVGIAKNTGPYWTFENIVKAVIDNKCKTAKSFQDTLSGAYAMAKRNKWLTDIYAKTGITKHSAWTLEQHVAYIHYYGHTTKGQINSARKTKVLSELLDMFEYDKSVPLIKKNSSITVPMRLKKLVSMTVGTCVFYRENFYRENKQTYTYDKCLIIAASYNNYEAWRKLGRATSYKAAYMYDWLERIKTDVENIVPGYMKSEKLERIYQKCHASMMSYKTFGEWKTAERNKTYQSAKRAGLLDRLKAKL